MLARSRRPLFRGGRSRAGARRDARGVEHEPGLVVHELALELEARRAVAVALPALGVVEAQVVLLEPLDAEAEGSDVRRRSLGPLADLQPEPVDGERVRESRGLEVDVEAAVELGPGLAVDRPAAAGPAPKRPLAAAAGRPARHVRAPRPPAVVQHDAV